jgi:cellulose biosynthesis protein BcsQ
MGHVITFYSFKGGTGRSMALANVGCLLAQGIASRNGKGVLLMDWDLEAPGLHRYFRDRLLNASDLSDEKTIDESPGLIDLLRIVDERLNATLSLNRETEESTRQILEEIDFVPFVLRTDISKLYVIKAGRFDGQYATRVNSFNWNDFYDRAPLFFQVFAQLLSERYDWVLVDSRTGFTDTSGICTTLLQINWSLSLRRTDKV